MKLGEKGFTLIEMIMVTAIIALIAGGTTMTMFQVVKGTERSNDRMAAVRQVQNAGYWISHDTQMAQSVEPAVAPGFPLTLTWTDWDSGDEHQIVYTLEDMSGSEFKKLQRSHSINGGDSKITFVAQYIDPATTECEFIDGMLIFTVTATGGIGSQEESETRVYKVIPGPSI